MVFPRSLQSIVKMQPFVEGQAYVLLYNGAVLSRKGAVAQHALLARFYLICRSMSWFNVFASQHFVTCRLRAFSIHSNYNWHLRGTQSIPYLCKHWQFFSTSRSLHLPSPSPSTSSPPFKDIAFREKQKAEEKIRKEAAAKLKKK